MSRGLQTFNSSKNVLVDCVDLVFSYTPIPFLHVLVWPNHRFYPKELAELLVKKSNLRRFDFQEPQKDMRSSSHVGLPHDSPLGAICDSRSRVVLRKDVSYHDSIDVQRALWQGAMYWRFSYGGVVLRFDSEHLSFMTNLCMFLLYNLDMISGDPNGLILDRSARRVMCTSRMTLGGADFEVCCGHTVAMFSSRLAGLCWFWLLYYIALLLLKHQAVRSE